MTRRLLPDERDALVDLINAQAEYDAAVARRNEALRAAHQAGASNRRLGELAQLSAEGVRKIIARERAADDVLQPAS